MRRLFLALAALILISGAVVVLPVISVPRPGPHAVAPTTYRIGVALPAGATAEPAAGPVARSTLGTGTGAAAWVAEAAANRSLRPLFVGAPATTKDFGAVGLSWLHNANVTNLQAKVRVRTGGTWTDWQPLTSTDLGTDNGKDGTLTPPRDGTDPLWVGRADGVQVQIDSVTGALPTDLRLDLVDPGSSAADSLLASKPAGSVAYADTGQPTIITRAQWGADESLRLKACPGGPESAGALKVAFVHHTATSNTYNPGDVPAIIRSIYAYHVQSEGWCDIGYNFLVDQFGRIFEGRFGGVANPILGSHTGGFNTASFGVAMIGTYDSVTPPPAMTAAMTQLIAWKLSISYLNPLGTETLNSASFDGNRYPPGARVAFSVISGHRDADQTSCPGNAGYAVLPALRQAVFAAMGAGLADPATTVIPRSIGANGAVEVTAGMLMAGSWNLLVQDSDGNTVTTASGSGATVDTTWAMTNAAGQPVPAGAYTLTLTSTQSGLVARPWVATVHVGAVFGALNAVTAPQAATIEVNGWVVHATDDTPVTARVTVSDANVGSVLATVARPDVAASHPGYGDDHGFDLIVSATPGYHTVCVYGINDETAGPDTQLGCITVDVPGALPHLTGRAANPVGAIDQVPTGPQAIRVLGWAFDPETAVPIAVAMTVDGAAKATVTANGFRPDVAAIHVGYGPSHGFDQVLAGIGAGVHRVCVTAINVGNGTANTSLGCVKVAVPTGNPAGNVDAIVAVPGGVAARGWATDPDTAGPIQVRIAAFGGSPATISAGQPRADIGAAFPLYGPAHGFSGSMALLPGRRTVCVTALNAGPGTANTVIGCRTLTVLGGNPWGSLDSATAADGELSVRGWALDPDVAAGIDVRIDVDGTVASTVLANQGRPDIGALYPGYGPAHGFSAQLPIAAGSHQVCAYAVNVGAGKVNTKLGCASLTVTG